MILAQHARHQRNRADERGFTLLELMLVMTLLGVVAGAAMLSPPDNSSRILAGTASELRDFLVATSADAVRRNENLGIVLQANTFFVASYSVTQGWQTAWHGAQALQLPDTIRMEISTQQHAGPVRHRASAQLSPDIVLLANGESTPFDALLSYGDASPERYALSSDGLNFKLDIL